MNAAQYFGSIAGIVGVTMFVISVGKRFVGNLPALQLVPTWCYAIVIAELLTAGAYQAGMLTGTFGDLSVQAVTLAAAASGFREWWVAGLSKPIADSTDAIRARRPGWR